MCVNRIQWFWTVTTQNFHQNDNKCIKLVTCASNSMRNAKMSIDVILSYEIYHSFVLKFYVHNFTSIASLKITHSRHENGIQNLQW